MRSTFDDHPLFLPPGGVANRLRLREQAIIEPNGDLLAGRRVLDIASHDGRWAFAALKAGAAHLTLIEPRPALNDRALSNFAAYGVDAALFRQVAGDVFTTLEATPLEVDTVLCLGFFYHTHRHVDLFHLMEQTGCEAIILDTEVAPERPQQGVPGDARLVRNNPNEIQFLLDPVDDKMMAAADPTARNGRMLVGRPSLAAIRFIAAHFGFACDVFDWSGLLERSRSRDSVGDYVEGWRQTIVCRRLGPASPRT